MALRSSGGKAVGIVPHPTGQGEYADTALLARCPYFQAVLAQFHCPLRAVRVLRLGAGSVIREHRDNCLGYADGEVRFHVPITTNPDVAFVVNGERLVMNPGECWYVNFNLPHRVANRGTTDRVHLVVDCAVNDWVTALLPAEITNPAPEPVAEDVPRSPEALDRFREVVLNDLALQEELRDVVDHKLFVSLVVRLGAERGCRMSPLDVDEALREGRRAWLERWVG